MGPLHFLACVLHSLQKHLRKNLDSPPFKLHISKRKHTSGQDFTQRHNSSFSFYNVTFTLFLLRFSVPPQQPWSSISPPPNLILCWKTSSPGKTRRSGDGLRHTDKAKTDTDLQNHEASYSYLTLLFLPVMFCECRCSLTLQRITISWMEKVLIEQAFQNVSFLD